MQPGVREHQQTPASENRLTWWAILLFVAFVGLAFAVATQFWSTIVPGYVRITATIAIALLTLLLASADLASDPLRIRKLLAAVFQGAIDTGPLDRWTVIHTCAGLIFGLWYLPLLFVLTIVVLWELFEILVPGFGEDESFWNRAIDIAVAPVGWAAVVFIVHAVTGVPVPILGRASS